MKIFLPSNGMMGLTSIDMRQPIIKDIRTLSNLTDNETLKKTEFLYQLCDKEKLNKITPSDRDYLFFIAASAFSMNVFNYSITCNCGHKNNAFLYSGQVHPVRLKYGEKRTVQKKIGKESYSFTRLNVEQESKCVFFAMDAEDHLYNETYQDAVVATTLYQDVTPELIEKVRNIDISVYYTAYFYQHFLPHGLDVRTTVTCEKCQLVTKVLHPIKASLINTDIQTMMNCFVSLGDRLTLQDFYDSTLAEYNLYVQALNHKLTKEQQTY
jgi:hypothetical protein